MTHDDKLSSKKLRASPSEVASDTLRKGNFNPKMRAYYRKLLESTTGKPKGFIRQKVQIVFATKAERAENKSFRDIPAQYALTAVQAQKSLYVVRELLVKEGIGGADIRESNIALCLFCATCGYTAQGKWHSSDHNFRMLNLGGAEGAERSSFLRAYKATRDNAGGAVPVTPSQFVSFQNGIAAHMKSDTLAPKGKSYEVRKIANWFGPVNYFKREDLPLMMYSGEAPRGKTVERLFDQILLDPQSALLADLRELAEATHFSARSDERQSKLRDLLAFHQPIKQIEHCMHLASLVVGSLFTTAPQYEVFGSTSLAANRVTDSSNRNVAHHLERLQESLGAVLKMDEVALRLAAGVGSTFRGDVAYLQDIAIGKSVFGESAKYLCEIASFVRQECGTLEDHTHYDGGETIDPSRRKYTDADGVLYLGGNVLEWFRNEALIVELVNTLPRYNRQFARRLFREVGYQLRTRYFTASSAPPTSEDRPS